MNTAKESPNKQLTPVNRTQIARTIFTTAESMGISDRHQIEKLTQQVIERLEQTPPVPEMETVRQPQPLPGMEHLVSKPARQRKSTPTKAEIQAIVKEILAAEEPTQIEEVKPTMETTATVKIKVQPASDITSSISGST